MRSYIAAKLSSKIEDIDLSLDDFVARVNSDLVGKFINIASRAAGFITKRSDGKLAATLPENSVLTDMQAAALPLAEAFEAREYAKALREVMVLADRVNAYVDANKPWELAKQEGQEARLHEVCTVLINAFRLLMTYLKPVLPKLAADVEGFLGIAPLTWQAADSLLLNHTIQPYQHLMTRIDPKQIEALIEANKESIEAVTDTAAPSTAPFADPITIDDFAKLDLRIATVLDCKLIEGSDKLLHFTVDLGSETRTIFSGIRAAYADPAALIGRKVVVVANLAPRKMRFGVSQGMILCASGVSDDSGLFLLDADQGAEAGMRIS